MDFMTTFKICGSGLTAQRAKMDVIASNLANISTSQTAEGGPYKKKSISFTAEPIEGNFGSVINEALQSVKVETVLESPNAVKTIYDPSHPDADAKGNVAMPDINVMQEMADMITASRAFEACVTAFDATKNMALKTLEMGR